MSRRPGAGGGIDRHALLNSGAYPSPSQSGYPRSHSPAGPAPSAGGLAPGVGGGGLAGFRSASPFEQPYTSSSTSGPGGAYQRSVGGGGTAYPAGPSSWDDEYGAPKKGGILPGGYMNGSGSGSGSGGAGAGAGGGWTDRIRSYAQQRTAQDLEEANDERLEGLSAKVKMLKDITVGIGNEVRDSTKDMDVLGGAFTTTSAFLGGTFTKMNRMASRQSSWFCNMMIFILFVIWIFVFLWWWRR
ncbi:unnamed protein product [Tilletia controversa]|uniref:t-SNARE coiled-coil homology domain-containing protein n=3 Tax=Tilletia TaxID=13289 RepID=A0A8X7MX06_9BASI|nr:hypothetical protein CF336_g1755 [Tilletia laevis]KAE8203318.1 hypothetical protein CF328_g1713 [Tilletia controversa]KAE8263984.1 hypothetical protein A4X03_0g1277 [Tilletia caries]KAE8252420.1 hypothetical protein A4X06_0g2200 [Tilletia controversa]CAD6888446.1 unnamed protein product [Tilletia caries]